MAAARHDAPGVAISAAAGAAVIRGRLYDRPAGPRLGLLQWRVAAARHDAAGIAVRTPGITAAGASALRFMHERPARA